MSEDYIKFTVNLPRALHKQAKIKAAQQETTLADVVRKCLEEFAGALPEDAGERQKKEEGKA